MGSHKQRFLHDLPTVVTFLAGETRGHSNHLMSGTFSLGFKNSEEGAPTGVQDGFRQMMVLDHVQDGQVFHDNTAIAFCIRPSYLELMIPPLTGDLEMGLSHIACCLPAAMAPFLASAQWPLLPPKRLLRGAIEAGVLYRLTFTIGQERLQPHVNANILVVASGRQVFRLSLCLTDNERIPMPIGAVNQMHGFGRAFYGAVQFDLEGFPQLSWNDQVLLIFMQIGVFAVLSELNGVPTMRLLKPRKANIRKTQLFNGEETLKGLRETVSQHLHRGGWHVLTTTAFEPSGQVVLRGEGALLCILLFDRLKHLVIEQARLLQAVQEQMGLFLLHEKPVLKRSHACILIHLMRIVKRQAQRLPQRRKAQFTPIAKARGTLAPLWVERAVPVSARHSPFRS